MKLFEMKYLNRVFYIVKGKQYADDCASARRIKEARRSNQSSEKPSGLVFPQETVSVIVEKGEPEGEGFEFRSVSVNRPGFQEYWYLKKLYHNGRFLFVHTSKSSIDGPLMLCEDGTGFCTGFYTFANELRFFDGNESRKIAEIGSANIAWMFAKEGQTAYFKFNESIFEATPDGVKEIAMLMLDGADVVVTYNVGEKTAFPPLTPEKTEAEKAAEEAVAKEQAAEQEAKKAAATEAAKRFLRNVSSFTVITVKDSVKRKYNGEYNIVAVIADAIFEGLITPEQVEEAAPECKDDLVSYINTACEGAWYSFEIE